MTPDNFIALEKFAEDLKTCFQAVLKDFPRATPMEQLTNNTLNYAIRVIDLHLDLARIELEQEGLELEKANGK
jgi:hypothetical protein